MPAAQRRSFVEQSTEATAQAANLADLALIDLSLAPRSGFKGRGTAEWLASMNVSLPEPNHAARQTDGSLAVRLAPREVLFLAPWSGVSGTLIDRLDRAWDVGRDPVTPRGYPVPRADSHLWFLLTGREVPAMLAKLCGVDFRIDRFAPLRVAQTQAAGLSVIVVRDDRELPAWHLLTDSASADYLWTGLLDAMQEFGGCTASTYALHPYSA